MKSDMSKKAKIMGLKAAKHTPSAAGKDPMKTITGLSVHSADVNLLGSKGKKPMIKKPKM